MRLSLLLALALAGCSASEAPPPDAAPQEYTGYYRTGFESSSFHPSGVKEQWWLKGAVPCGGFNVGPDVAGFPARDWVHLAVEGRVSPKGHYGHMGGYTRELVVTKVLSCRSLHMGERVEL